MDFLVTALFHWRFPAFIPCNLFTVRPGDGPAVGGLLDLAVEGVGHPGARVGLRFMIPDLLLVIAGDLWHDKLHILGHQFTLLPGHWFTCLGSSPNLISITVCLPICDTVLFGNIPALGQQLLVGNLLLVLGALLLHKLLGGEDGLAELLRFQSLFALFVWHNFTNGLSDINTHILSPIFTLLHPVSFADLAIPLHPDNWLISGHIHTKFLVMKINLSIIRMAIVRYRLSSRRTVTTAGRGWWRSSVT